MLRIPIILGSIREGRNGEKVAKWLLDVAKKRGDLEVELIDLQDWNLPMFASATPPSMGPATDPLIRKWAEKIASADGYVWVTPEYNHGYSSVLKNAIDHVYHEWKRKPVAMVSYGGGAGGARAAEGLRLVAGELHLADVRENLAIVNIWAAFDDKGQPTDASLEKKANAMLDDLKWWGEALKTARDAK